MGTDKSADLGKSNGCYFIWETCLAWLCADNAHRQSKHTHNPDASEPAFKRILHFISHVRLSCCLLEIFLLRADPSAPSRLLKRRPIWNVNNLGIASAIRPHLCLHNLILHTPKTQVSFSELVVWCFISWEHSQNLQVYRCNDPESWFARGHQHNLATWFR